MREDIVSKLIKDKANTYVEFAINRNELKAMILDIIKVKTGFDITKALSVYYDENDYSMIVDIDETELNENEIEALEKAEYFVYTTSSNVNAFIRDLFDENTNGWISTNAIEIEACEDDYLCILSIPITKYNELLGKIEGNKYLVVVRDSYTRDIQIADSEDAYNNDASNDWKDFQGEAVVGVFEAVDENDAMKEVADNGYFKNSLKVYKLD